MLRSTKHCKKCGRKLYSTASQQEGVCAFCYRKSTAKARIKAQKSFPIEIKGSTIYTLK